MNQAWLLAKAIESAQREKILVEGFEAIREAYFAEYTDATEFDSEFKSALRHIFDTCFPAGLNDGRDFDEVLLGRSDTETT